MYRQEALKKLNQIISILSNEGYSLEKKDFNYNFSLIVSSGNIKVTVNIFFGKQGVKVNIQGSKDSVLYNNVSKLLGIKDTPVSSKPKNSINEFDSYTGCDESGKGDFFGPLVICSFYVDEKTKEQLSGLGIKDSKELVDSQINSIAAKIERKKLIYNTLVVDPESYNRLYDKYQNLNILLSRGHCKNIDLLYQMKKFDNVIIDKFGKEDLIRELLAPLKLNVVLETKAEKYLAVAAASIMARYELNKWFEKASTEIGIKIPKGASSIVEKTAKEIRNKFGDDVLTKLVKRHFKTSNKIL